MDYLQYLGCIGIIGYGLICFKPCYKWITFNTKNYIKVKKGIVEVLNLVINGLPSIRKRKRFRRSIQNCKF